MSESLKQVIQLPNLCAIQSNPITVNNFDNKLFITRSYANDLKTKILDPLRTPFKLPILNWMFLYIY